MPSHRILEILNQLYSYIAQSTNLLLYLLVSCDKDGTKTLFSKDDKLPVNLHDVSAEFYVEVNRETRTIRFLINGDEAYDSEFPNPLSMVGQTCCSLTPAYFN